MKKLLLLAILATSASITSCSTTKSAENAQAQRAEIAKLKGAWELANVDYDKGYKVKPFDEGADISCWVGSVWQLVPNNNTGSYQLNGGGSCPSVTQKIEFEVTSNNTFKFKKIAQGEKAKEVTAGYELGFTNQTPDSFSLVQQVPADGKTLTITYNFQRTGVTTK